MKDINVLMVLDGNRFNFGPAPASPTSPENDNYFSITTVVGALEGNATPSFKVDKAHRRGATYAGATAAHSDCSAGLTIPGDFTFTAPGLNLDDYDVIWIIADEGYNGGAISDTAVFSEITPAEQLAIAQFMQNGGGVFAVGDHDGIGAYMCGKLPRIRTMRKWFEWDHPFTDPGTTQVFMTNWSVDGNMSNTGYPAKTDRFDTLQPDSGDGQFYFFDQSDQSPQPLYTQSGAALGTAAVHAVLRGAGGAVVVVFPDHMHEGEATDLAAISTSGSPFVINDAMGNPNTLSVNGTPIVEFPSVGNFQPTPEVVVYGQDTGHSTYYNSSSVPTPPFGQTNAKRRGLVSVYDGRAVGVGRIATGSTFHHYLDKNLIGDPSTASATAGVGPTGTDTGFTSLPAILGPITQYYVNVATWVARQSSNFYFWVLKNTFGSDEASSVFGHPPGNFANAFYIAIEGLAPSVVGALPPIVLSGPFKDMGATFAQGNAIPEDPAHPNQAQRILVPFSVTAIPPGLFPPSGTKVLTLEAELTLAGTFFAAEAIFELGAAADPYFRNVDPADPLQPWYLSQDLRVFQIAPGLSTMPFGVAWPGDPYTYIQNLLLHLNAAGNNFTNGGTDPFQVLNEMGDLTEDSSVKYWATGPLGLPLPIRNYNFAVARVRLRGTTGMSASDVKVFFRLFATQSNDTDYDEQTTYACTYDASHLPDQPLVGAGETSYPMFATSGGGGDYDTGAKANDQTITALSSSSETLQFYASYLDVFNNPAVTLIGDHHCLVAQIAYDGAPILNSNGISLSPENSDKLAQRNLEVTPSGNPTGPAGHRCPQTFDLRPSVRTAAAAGTLAGYPDELMIDWGKVPFGSKAQIYWPQASAADVVRLAMLLYSTDQLRMVDEHTIECTVSTRITYVPIPFGTGSNFAGLFTVDLNAEGRYGEDFQVVVRRISTRRTQELLDVKRSQAASKRERVTRDWRYIVGSFQVTIPVRLEDELLWPEENKLAIMKWRLHRTPTSNRWHLVLKRYVDYIAGRVNAFGGNAVGVLPSPTGAPLPALGGTGKECEDVVEHTGKVCEVIYDCFGDFEGFVVDTCCGGGHTFASREKAIGELALRACRERLLVSVFADRQAPHKLRRVIVKF